MKYLRGSLFMIAMVTGILFTNLPSVGPVAATGDPSRIVILSSESDVSVKCIEESGKQPQGTIVDSENGNLELRVDVRVENLPPQIELALPEYAHVAEPLLFSIDFSDPNTEVDLDLVTIKMDKDGVPILRLNVKGSSTEDLRTPDVDLLSTDISHDGIILRLNSIQPGIYEIHMEAGDESFSTSKNVEFKIEL